MKLRGNFSFWLPHAVFCRQFTACGFLSTVYRMRFTYILFSVISCYVAKMLHCEAYPCALVFRFCLHLCALLTAPFVLLLRDLWYALYPLAVKTLDLQLTTHCLQLVARSSRPKNRTQVPTEKGKTERRYRPPRDTREKAKRKPSESQAKAKWKPRTSASKKRGFSWLFRGYPLARPSRRQDPLDGKKAKRKRRQTTSRHTTRKRENGTAWKRENGKARKRENETTRQGKKKTGRLSRLRGLDAKYTRNRREIDAKKKRGRGQGKEWTKQTLDLHYSTFKAQSQERRQSKRKNEFA
jgi:hypothetical protein